RLAVVTLPDHGLGPLDHVPVVFGQQAQHLVFVGAEIGVASFMGPQHDAEVHFHEPAPYRIPASGSPGEITARPITRAARPVTGYERGAADRKAGPRSGRRAPAGPAPHRARPMVLRRGPSQPSFNPPNRSTHFRI